MFKKLCFLISFVLVIALTVSNQASADTLYYDNFDGPADVNLNGTTPDTTIGSNIWVAGADFDANGSVVWDGNGFGDSAYLPFTPADGYIYTLSATISVYGATVPDNNWVAVGFTQSNANPESRFYGDNGSRSPIYWGLSRTDTADLNDQTFTGPDTAGGEDSDTISEDNIDIVLDTTLSPWVVQWYYNNVLKRTVDVAEAQKSNFNYVAISENRCDALISEFSLTRDLSVYAADPDPVNGLVGVPRNVVLQWTPGVGANTHDVYFGTDFNDVRDANRSNPLGVLVSENQSGSTHDPCGVDFLEFIKTYYWRIDEVESGGSPIHKGQVWTFMTELEAGIVTLYRDDFNGTPGTDLDGTKPDVTIGENVWDAGLSVDADGTLGSMFTAGLEFTPEVGAVYELSATVDNYGDWVALGFHSGNFNPASRPRYQSPVLWALVRQDGSTEKDQVFIGPDVSNGLGNANTSSAEEMKIRVELNSATNWLVTWYFDGSQEFQETVNPVAIGFSIDYAIFGSNGYFTPVTGTISSFKLVVIPQAMLPNPANGSLAYSTNVNLQWQPGIYAVKHDVYVGTDFDDVNNADRDSHPNLTYYNEAQDANNFLASGLISGETYYWRIDGVRSDGITIDKGEVWSFMVQPLTAYNPSPPDEAKYVAVDEDLYWDAGYEAEYHDIYFGTDFDDVNNATRASHPGLLHFVQNHDTNSYDPGTLNRDTTYYWRIDEVNDPCIWKGDVWSFESRPTINISDPTLLAHWTFDEGYGTIALDWSGHEKDATLVNGPKWAEGEVDGALQFDGVNDYVDAPIGDTINTLTSCTIVTWVNFANIGFSQQRIFDFGTGTTAYMRLVACDGWPGAAMTFGITTTGSGGESVLTGPVLTSGWHHVAVAINGVTEEMEMFLDGVSVSYNFTTTIPSDLGVTTNNWLGRSQFETDGYFTGFLDDFRIYNYAMTQEDLKNIIAPKKAWLPNPADGATSVYRYPVLTWEPGKYAASVNGHKLYYSTNYNDVNDPCNRVGDPVVLSDPCYAIPAPNAPYGSEEVVYWVVDEVNNLHAEKKWPGDVWSFTIRDESLIDDFDLYSDTGWVNPYDLPDPPPPGTLRSVWIDGYDAYEPDVTPGSSGSFVQLNTDPCDCHPFHRPCEHYIADENGIYLSEGQSMKFYYDNDGTVEWQDILYYYDYDIYTPSPNPYLSEAYAAVDDAAADADRGCLKMLRDWSGYNVLDIPFYGDPDNAAEGMYVSLEDGDGTVVTIQHPAPDLTKPMWQDWYIKLSDFTAKNSNLDFNDIAKIYLGFGNKQSPSAGGSGMVFFDDIQLSPGICFPGTVIGDFDDDCTINNSDLEIFTYGFPGKMPTLSTPIIELDADDLDVDHNPGDDVTSWSNTGSKLGTFTDTNAVDTNEPVFDMILGKYCVTFDANDMLVWDQNAPATITSANSAPNDFTVIYEVYNPEIANEELLFNWAQRGGPAGTCGGVGYGSNAAWGAVVHWNEGGLEPDMGFDRGVPTAGQWHIIGVTYDGTTEALAVDGALHNLEYKDLIIYDVNQPVTVGAPYLPESDTNLAWDTLYDAYVPVFDNYRYNGSIASIKVYAEAIAPGDLAILTASLAGLSNAETDIKPDGKIDFGDLAVMGYEWVQDPYLFGKDY